jgi:hypothetical protein
MSNHYTYQKRRDILVVVVVVVRKTRTSKTEGVSSGKNQIIERAHFEL